MITVELMGGPRDGEVPSVPLPAPWRLEFACVSMPRAGFGTDGLVSVTTGSYVRNADLRCRGTMVRYDG